MKNLKQIGIAGALGAVLFIAPGLSVSAANAAPGIATHTDISVGDPSLHKVGRHDRRRGHWNKNHRRKHWRKHRRHYDDNWNPGAYIALGVIGALVDRGLDEGSARSAMQRCDDRFRSFEWDTGLYTTYGGRKRLCPYLR